MSFNCEGITSDMPYSLWSVVAPAGGMMILSCLSCLSCLSWRWYRHAASALEENQKELSVLRSALAQRDAEVVSLRRALSEPTQQAPKAPSRKDGIEVQALRRRISDLNKELEEFRAHNRDLTLEVQAGREELHGLGVKLQQSDKLSRARAEELRVAQVFLSTADQFSGFEIIQAVEALNEEISGIAATLADVYEQAEMGVDNPMMDIAYGHLAGILGDMMASFVKSNSQYEVLQVAFSAAICAHVGQMVMSWSIRRDTGKEKSWDEVFSRIRRSEKQAIAGRWRSLTQKAIIPSSKHDEAAIEAIVTETLVNILIVAGIDPGDKKVVDKLANSGLAKKVMELRFGVWQGVTSCEMQPVYAAPGLPFNSGMMEDALGQGDSERQDSQNRICCTTELGLAAVESQGEASRTSPKILKKAKVILLSGLNEIVA
ncbi:uncharacterized protein EV420DRAFT_835195 [Desarmillaria tabescens]|uniref:Uncharacterized protein n=1 Tax=Armillaria tabescens TaxID=1929756 RepID=A0AA39JU40_ARMTA|nr:uncharacterized protein EV420DRAFT_835195 [Desarmillaria tabescens]KAK0448945.1 hypothetical protein EV420DRAFT_835195 [Desarmillaria tabescens]